MGIHDSVHLSLFKKVLQNERMMKRIRQVRFVQFHTIILIVVGFPVGLAIFLYRIFIRLRLITQADTVAYLIPFHVLSYTEFLLCPLSYAFLLEDWSIARILVPCLRQVNPPNLPLNLDDNDAQSAPQVYGWKVDPIPKRQSSVKLKEKSVTWSAKTGIQFKADPNNFELVEMSLLTTVGLTHTSGSVSQARPQIVSSEHSIFSQESSIPSLLTPSTAAKLQNIAVEVHREHRNPNDTDEEMHDMRNSET